MSMAVSIPSVVLYQRFAIYVYQLKGAALWCVNVEDIVCGVGVDGYTGGLWALCHLKPPLSAHTVVATYISA